MPSSSTALNIGLWGVPFRGGIPLGELTLAYQSDVEAVSAISPQALIAVNNLLYAQYPNGSGSTGRVADFIDDIDYLWPCMGDDLDAALVCVKGSNTNVGLVSGDYDQQKGILFDTGYLRTNFKFNNTDDVCAGGFVNTSSSTETVNCALLGAYKLGEPQGGFIIYSSNSVDLATNYRMFQANSSNISNSNIEGFYALNIKPSGTDEGIKNGVVIDSRESGDVDPGFFVTIGDIASSDSTTFNQKLHHYVSAAFLANKSLSTIQMTVLYNAINAFNTAGNNL